MKIGMRDVGPGQPCYVVAEISGNHNGSLQTAEAIIREAAMAGADAVKTQIFEPSAMALDTTDPRLTVTWQGRTVGLHALYAETAMPLDWHIRLRELAGSLGLAYIASVFDANSIDLAVELNLPAIKIASFEITDVTLLRLVAETGRPVIVSTGMAAAEEVSVAVNTIKTTWNRASMPDCGLALLHCVSAYPAPLADTRLARMCELPSRIRGLSDHGRNNMVVAAAVALGAAIVERHIRLDDDNVGPDTPFSDTPAEFADMIRAIRDVETAIGEPTWGPSPSELPMLYYRRSIWITRDIAAGEPLTPDNIAILRPADGLPPAVWPYVLGLRAARPLKRGEPLRREALETWNDSDVDIPDPA